MHKKQIFIKLSKIQFQDFYALISEIVMPNSFDSPGLIWSSNICKDLLSVYYWNNFIFVSMHNEHMCVHKLNEIYIWENLVVVYLF